MPDAEIPGPPAGYDEEQQRIWCEGAAAVAKLQAQQWAVIADQYTKAAEGRADEDEPVGEADADSSEAASDAAAEESDACPECGTDLVDGFGGQHCPSCGFEPNSE
jgi:hypothetical protein